jgi:hypothetical protein
MGDKMVLMDDINVDINHHGILSTIVSQRA